MARGARQGGTPRRLAVALGLATAMTGMGYVKRAEACSCSDRAINELQVGDGRIPANTGGIVWWFAAGYRPAPAPSAALLDEASSLERQRSLVTLQRWSGTTLQEVPTHLEQFAEKAYLIRPDVRWSPGERYRLSVDAGEEYGSPDTRSQVTDFEVVPALEDGEWEPVLEHSDAQYGRIPFLVRDGSCGVGRDAAFVDVDLHAPEGLANWPRALLLYTTYVDDRKWSHFSSFCSEIEPGASWSSRSGNRVVAACDGQPEGAELSAGSHSVRMEARLPGTEVVFSSATIEVGLRCATAVVAAPALEEGPSAGGCSFTSILRSGDSQRPAALWLLGFGLAVARRRSRAIQR